MNMYFTNGLNDLKTVCDEGCFTFETSQTFSCLISPDVDKYEIVLRKSNSHKVKTAVYFERKSNSYEFQHTYSQLVVI